MWTTRRWSAGRSRRAGRDPGVPGVPSRAAREVMQTSHWTWAGQKVKLPARRGRPGRQAESDQQLLHPRRSEHREVLVVPRRATAGATRLLRFQPAKTTWTAWSATNRPARIRRDSPANPEAGVDLRRGGAGAWGGRHARTAASAISKAAAAMRSSTAIWTARCTSPRNGSTSTWAEHGFQCVDCHRTQQHRIPGCSHVGLHRTAAARGLHRLPQCHSAPRRAAGRAHPRRWPARPATFRGWRSTPRRRWTGTGPRPARTAARKIPTCT